MSWVLLPKVQNRTLWAYPKEVWSCDQPCRKAGSEVRVQLAVFLIEGGSRKFIETNSFVVSLNGHYGCRNTDFRSLVHLVALRVPQLGLSPMQGFTQYLRSRTGKFMVLQSDRSHAGELERRFVELCKCISLVPAILGYAALQQP